MNARCAAPIRSLRRVVVLAVALVAPACSTSDNQGPQVTVLRVIPESLFLARGDSDQLTVAVFSENGARVPEAGATFHSSDTTIVRVTLLGKVYAGQSIGAATITVSGGSAHRDIPARIIAVPASITLAPADTNIRVGGGYDLTAVAYDEHHVAIAGAQIRFQTGDSTIAKINSTGVVTGVGAGTVSFLVTSGGALASADVTVLDTSIIARVTLPFFPYGAAANHQGVAYVLQPGANSAARFNLPDTVAAATVSLHGTPTSVAFDSGGTTAYATAQGDGVLDVINVNTNAITTVIPMTGNPFIVRVSPDDKSIWVSTNADSVYQIDRATKSILARYGVALVPNGMAFAPTNDSLLYVSTLDSGKVVEINYKQQTLGRTFSPGGRTQAIVIAPDGSKLYVSNETLQEIEVYDLASGNPLAPISTAGAAFDLELSPDGNTLWVGNAGIAGVGGEVRTYDRATGALLRRIVTGGAPRRIALTPATNVVIVANDAGWVDFVK